MSAFPRQAPLEENPPQLEVPEVSRVDIAIIGSGFSGLGMAIQLRERGERSFVVFEKEQEVGGTWRDNHYPGCACDIPSHLYSFSFAQNPDWSRQFAPQNEIQAYLLGCAEKYDVRRHLRFGCEITRAEFDEGLGRWRLFAGPDLVAESRFLVSGIGGLHRPLYPDIPGLGSFQGRAFHSADWDHACDLRGKRVAVIGTGASAIQFVPQIAPIVAKLDLFQRTPPWIMPKSDSRFSSLWRAAFKWVPPLRWAFRSLIYWYLEGSAEDYLEPVPESENEAKTLALSHLRRQVSDPALRAALTPDYQIGCKRVLLSNDYYPAVARPNVELIATSIDEATPTGLVLATGAERQYDAIIFGTGFRVTDPLSPLVVAGRGGRTLNEEWREGGRAYLGITVAGFPNMFLLMGPNTGLGHNSMIYMIECQIHYALAAMEAVRKHGARFLDVRPEVQARFDETIQQRLGRSVWASGCKSWYVSPEGRNSSTWPDNTYVYRSRTRSVRPDDYVFE